MNTCSTCRHWSPWPENQPYNGGIPAGLCNHPKVGVEDDPTPRDGLGIFCHESGAGMKTGPDFGCIHHAPV